MNRRCVCGNRVPNNWYLCKECLAVYGKDQSDWPAWLAYGVADIQREWDYKRTHDELEYNDEVLYSGNNTNVVKGQHYSPSMGWGSYSDVD